MGITVEELDKVEEDFKLETGKINKPENEQKKIAIVDPFPILNPPEPESMTLPLATPPPNIVSATPTPTPSPLPPSPTPSPTPSRESPWDVCDSSNPNWLPGLPKPPPGVYIEPPRNRSKSARCRYLAQLESYNKQF